MRAMRRSLCLALAAVGSVVTATSSVPFDWRPQISGVSVRLRGVSVVSAHVAWASGAEGTVLRTTDGGETWSRRPVPGGDSSDFRDVDAFSDRVAYVLSIGPGEASRIYKTNDGGERWDLQFKNLDPKGFLDAMTFRDETHGLAFGDSVDGALVVLTTSNGGRSWERVGKDRLPAALPSEGAFAASGTNVAMVGHNVWIGTNTGRVLRSADGGLAWAVATTPLASGDSAGIFSIAFRDAHHGVVVGGDYKKEPVAVDNAAFTSDGGVTWTLVKDHGLSGFRSVVAWVPGAEGSLLAIGPTGADWSSDDGHTWAPLAGPGFDTFSFAPEGRVGWAAGLGGRIAKATLR